MTSPQEYEIQVSLRTIGTLPNHGQEEFIRTLPIRKLGLYPTNEGFGCGNEYCSGHNQNLDVDYLIEDKVTEMIMNEPYSDQEDEVPEMPEEVLWNCNGTVTEPIQNRNAGAPATRPCRGFVIFYLQKVPATQAE